MTTETRAEIAETVEAHTAAYPGLVSAARARHEARCSGAREMHADAMQTADSGMGRRVAALALKSRLSESERRMCGELLDAQLTCALRERAK